MPFTETLKSRVRKKAHLSCCLCQAIGVEVHHIIVPEEENGPDTAVGVTLGPFIAIGAGVGAVGYGLYWLDKQVGRPKQK